MLDIFQMILLYAYLFSSKITFSKKIFLEYYTIRVSNSLWVQFKPEIL